MKTKKYKNNKLLSLKIDTSFWCAANELERVGVDLDELKEKYNKLIDYLAQKKDCPIIGD